MDGDDDKGGDQPPGDRDSLNVARRGGAEVAAELAARIARLRAARAGRSTSPSTDDSMPPHAATPPRADRLAMPEPSAMMVGRIDRALRAGKQVRPPRDCNIWVPSAAHAHSNGVAFRSLLAEGPNMNAIGMRPECESRPPLPTLDKLLRSRPRAIGAATRRGPVVAWRPLAAGLGRSLSSAGAVIATARSAGSQRCTRAIRAAAPVLHDRIEAMQRRVRAVGAVARYAASDRLVVSALAAIAVAAAAWLFMSFDRPVRMTAHPSPAASAPDDTSVATVAPPSTGATSVAAEPAPGSARLEARLKPALPWPSLTVRLKPADPESPLAIDTPGHGQAPHKGGDPRTADSIIKRMFGADQGVSRQPSHPSV